MQKKKTTRARRKRTLKDEEALFDALGYFRHGNTLWFYFETRAGVRWFRSATLCREGAAFELHPDPEHWKLGGTRVARDGSDTGRTDWTVIGADLIRLAIEAGPYQPAPEDMPRGPGRPKKERS